MTAQGSNPTDWDEQTCPLCITSVSLDSISICRSGGELGENDVAPWFAISIVIFGYCRVLFLFMMTSEYWS